ncbi:ribonuclease H-like domain-containing protein [Pyronema domesticum]|uniref:Similar to Exosome complex exonuclease rrp6 acc. no. Q10146 n=1 Tax=Pyronema omphalodes (strain CBS 100304) TaxID=1076935 RepID=U4LC10_PYROM|nr:ribonuclease H-like domain-containing protein [Pyronema domesticum]CCX17119.1 Similar to Exosome complex exonuclease rrp6; acc. no. Q10146 [Pyronema omphalodes CBS 100304]
MTDSPSEFSQFQDGIFGALMPTVKAIGTLAAGDIDFQRSSDGEFAKAADATGARILELANLLLKSAALGGDIDSPVLKEEDDVDTKWSGIVDVADFLLERADTSLDEYTGAIKQKNPEPLPGAAKAQAKQLSRSQQKAQSYWASANSWSTKHLNKPQLLFDVKPNNFDDSPFRPLLVTKPNAKIPYEKSFEMFTNEKGSKQYIHPYIEEIKSMEYPASVFEHKEPQEYLPFEDTEATMVDTPELLSEMLNELKEAKEIAIDLEHHDQRSYIGIVCLMQISTRSKDWIVDTLKLRGELQVLNEVFTNPSILKVLHGASMDIIWLQRDFGLYIVGLFDTYWAARTLGFQGHGLAFLLKRYVDFDADKQYQLADWRLRPLPEGMFNYARSDTHFLLYIYDHLRNELIGKSSFEDPENKLNTVLHNSQEVSLRLYERESYDAEGGDGQNGWRNMLGRTNEGLNPMQAAVFKAVHQWRDKVAREEDESVAYIMARHQLFNLARKMPVDAAGVLGCCPRPSPPVTSRAQEIVDAIAEAKLRPEVLEWQKSLAVAVAPVVSEDATAQQEPERSIKTDYLNPSAEELSKLRVSTSVFWGPCAYSSLWEPVKEEADIRLAVPLPQLTAEVFVTDDGVVKKNKEERPEHEYIKNRPVKKNDEVIIVKSLGGRKRKVEEAVSEEDAEVAEAAPKEDAFSGDGDEVMIPEGAKKKDRSSKKRKSIEGQDEAQEQMKGEKEPMKPFDYASAPTVLNQKPEPENKKDKHKKKKAFNPYAASSNAPKGLNRKNQERTGRSSTFQHKK